MYTSLDEAFRFYNKRLRTCVTLALDIPRWRAKSAWVSISAWVSMPLVPINDFHCLAHSIASSLSNERGFLGGLVILSAGFNEKIID
jgi:hypothetical protein